MLELTATKLAELDTPITNINVNTLIEALELYIANVSILLVDLDL